VRPAADPRPAGLGPDEHVLDDVLGQVRIPGDDGGVPHQRAEPGRDELVECHVFVPSGWIDPSALKRIEAAVC
jgi:hypothetical protein